MDIKKLIKKLLLIPLVFIVILAIIAVSGLRSWNDMLIPIIGVLIGEIIIVLLYFYFFKIHKNNEDTDK